MMLRRFLRRLRRFRSFLRRFKQAAANSLKSLVRRFNAAVPAAVCGGCRKSLKSFVRWLCGRGLGVCPPYPLYAGALL